MRARIACARLTASPAADVAPTSAARSRSRLLCGLLEVEHPVDAEAIRQHRESLRPERLFQRHGDLALPAQILEEELDLLDVVALDADGEVATLPEGHAGLGVTGHEEHGVALAQLRTHDPILGFLGIRNAGPFPRRAGAAARLPGTPGRT